MASTYDKNVVLAKGLGYQDAIIFWDMEKETIVDFYNYYYEYSAADQGLDFRGHSPIALYERDGNYFTMIYLQRRCLYENLYCIYLDNME